MIKRAFDSTMTLLTERKAEIEKVAQLLLKKEVLGREDMINLLGPRPFDDKSKFDDYIKTVPDAQPDADGVIGT